MLISKSDLKYFVRTFVTTPRLRMWELLNPVRSGELVFTMFMPSLKSKAAARVITNNIRRVFAAMGSSISFGPDAVTIAVTNKCPCNCPHCSAYGREGENLSSKDIKRVIDELLSLGTYNITFTGGEPLIRDDLPELIEYVDKKKAMALIFTTGFFSDENLITELKKKGLFGMFVSLDAGSKDKHDTLRRCKVFDKAIETINIAKKVGLLIGISTYGSHENLRNKELLEIIELSKRLDVHEVVIFDSVPTGKAIEKEDMMLTEDEHEYLINIHREFAYKLDYPKITTMSLVNNVYYAGCFAGSGQIHITHSGEVTPCDFTPLTFGNVKDMSIKEIWQKIRGHPAYRLWKPKCRMQTKEFREKYINKIPKGSVLPYPIEKLE